MPIDTYIPFSLFNIQRVNQLLFREIQFWLFVTSLKRYKFYDKCKKKTRMNMINFKIILHE